MELGVLSTLMVGLFLGIKHSLEPDHVIAVSTIASKSKSLFRSLLAGVFWGLGHSSVLFIVGLLIIALKFQIPPKIESCFEMIVGIMLIYLGITSILGKKHRNYDKGILNDLSAVYMKSVAVGSIHGLAGSAALTVLALSTVNNLLSTVLYILFFGAGTIIGMSCFTTALAIPIVLSVKHFDVKKTLEFASSIVSICFGIYYLYRIVTVF
jgi:nickel/cobalt transporter (NicO) family protein